MKKTIINRLLAGALSVFALTACTNETSEGGLDGRTPLTVSNSSIASSRATDNTWENKDAIGVILFEGGTSSLVEGNPTVGKYVTTNGKGAFTPVDKANTLYFPTQNKKADVVAFYPYTTVNGSLTVPVNVADQSKLSAIDLMVADKVKDKSAADDEVSLKFRHKLVKLDFTVDCNASTEGVDISAATLVLKGTPTTAAWDLAAASLKAESSSVKDIALPVTYDKKKKTLSASAIAIPCDVKNVKLVVTAGQYAFDVPFTANMVLKAGTKNTLRVHLNRTDATLEATVEDWTTGVTADLESLKLTTVGTDGNVEGLTDLNLWLADAPAAKVAYTWNATTEDWTSTAPFYLEDLDDDDRFFARHTPATADATTGVKDILGNTSGASISNGGISVTLEHLMSKLTIALARGTDFSEEVSFDGAKISIPDILPEATLSDANVATATGDAKTYELAAATDYIFVPQSLAAGTEVTVTLSNGNSYKAAFSGALEMKQGTANKLTLTLSPTATAIAVSVKDWATGANAEGTALNITVTATDGTDAGITALNVWNTKDNGITADYAYTVATGWSSSTPYYIEDYAATDLFFARHTPATADATTGVKDILGNTSGASISNGGISVTLEHLMSKLTIALARGTDFSEEVSFDGAKISIPDILPEATLSDANVATATGDAKTYELAAATDYIFVPQSLAAGTEVTVALSNGNSYKAALTGALEMKQGTANKLTLTLSPTATAIAVSVKDWATGADAASTLAIVTTGTADELTDNSTFSTLNIFVDALTGTPYEYTKTNGAWTSANPLYLDELVAASKLYAQTVNSTADAVTALTDVLGTDATAVKGGVAAFTFRHLLAQMSITLAQGEGFTPSLDGAVITTPDMIKGYTVATDANGNMTAVAGTETQAYTLTDDDAHLVVPQTLAQGSVFTVKLTNGNTYTASLAEAVTLEAGKNTTVTLTLNTTATGVKVAMTDWGIAAAETAMKLAGLTDGTVTYAANEGDILTVYYNEVNTTAVQGSFKYENNAWTVNTPLYWDEVAQTGYTKKFIAVLTPAEQTTPFADFFVGTATDVTFGSEVSFTLQHAAAQFSFVINAGTGIDDLAAEVPTRTFTLGEGDVTSVNADGTINYGTLTDTDYTIGTEPLFVTPQTLTDSHVVTLTRANGNKYTVKLADLMNGTDNLFTGGKVEAGKHYTITLTVNESTVGITAGIAAWTDVSGSGTAKPEF